MGFHSPATLSEALDLLAGSNATVLAGGTDFFPSLKQGAVPETLINIARLDELRGITKVEDVWRIGAAVRWSEIAKAGLPPFFDGLRLAAREVGSVQIQNAGTVGGNLCNASPAADGVPPLLALGASVELATADGTRTLPLERFIRGVRKTDRAEGEIVTAILIPDLPAGTRAHFLKLGSRKYLVISIAMVSTVVRADAAGRIEEARIAIGSCSAVALRIKGLEAAVTGMTLSDLRNNPRIWGEHLNVLHPISDIRGSAGFRADVAGELCRRSIMSCLLMEDAAGG